MDWRAGKLSKVSFGRPYKLPRRQAHRMKWNVRKIPVPYVWLSNQFTKEDLHAEQDDSHKAARCQSYTWQILHAFGDELKQYRGCDTDFQSYVFTPVLQHQLQGVLDCYAPAIFNAIVEGDSEEITILNATKFYLSIDPLNPMWIPSYQWNMLYICKVRWHLAILMKKAVTLVAGRVLPGGHIESLLRVFKQFTHI